jgi:prepilin-type N-terminal cleavage/methylation domain-containing protein/prepilin-type processing-associated H-X9-DG protein
MARCLRQGLTIIELLTVISIIVILLAILLPGFRAAKEQARCIRCVSNLGSLGLAVLIYAQENDGWLPPAEPRDKDDVGSRDNWYLNIELMGCMNVAPQRDANGLILGPSAEGTILVCPSHYQPKMSHAVLPDFPARERPYALSYMVNGTWRLSNRGGKSGSYRHVSEFTRPSKTLAMCDGNGYERARAIVLYEACPSHNFEHRHRGKVNVLFLDKHVGSLKENKVPLGRKVRYYHFWSEKKR